MSKYVTENKGGRVGEFYKVPSRSKHGGAPAALLWNPWFFSNNLPSMCLSLLESNGKQTKSCQPASEEPTNPGGTAGFVFTSVSQTLV